MPSWLAEYLHWLDVKVDSHGEAGVGIGNQGLLATAAFAGLIAQYCQLLQQ
jgi:hypothetical protein